MKPTRIIPVIIALLLTACNDEPAPNDGLPINRRLMQCLESYDGDWFNAPANPPECLVINSARDLADLPEGTLDKTAELEYSQIDFAKNTLIVITSVVYCEPDTDDGDWNWAIAQLDFKKDYVLNIKYEYCAVVPTPTYSAKCKIQFAFTTDKIPSDTKITVTESQATI